MSTKKQKVEENKISKPVIFTKMKKWKVSAHLFPIFNLLNHMEFSHYKSTQCCMEGQAQVPSPALPHSRSRSRHQNPHIVLPAQMPTPRRCWSHRYRMIMVKQSYFQGSLSKRFLNAYFMSSLLHFISSLLTLGGRTGSFQATERRKPSWWQGTLLRLPK